MAPEGRMLLAFINFQIAVHKHHNAHTNKPNVREDFSREQRKAEAGGRLFGQLEDGTLPTCPETERVK